jgi:hypothetical protein
MSKPHERIWAKNGHDSWGQYGHWYADSKGGGVEYVLADRIEELEAKLAKAVGHIEWFISEDETNRGDEPMPELGDRTWDEINEYWIKHLDSAIEFIAELKAGE